MIAKATTQIPQRTCIVCRKTADQHALVKLAVDPDGAVMVDYDRRLPGRGSYLCPTAECFKAVNAGQLKKAFHRGPLSFDSEMVTARLEQLNEKRLKETLYMAQKANAVCSGRDSVLQGINDGRVKLVLLSEDCGPNTQNQFIKKAVANNVEIAVALPMDKIGKALGKPPRAVVGIGHPAFAARIRQHADMRMKILDSLLPRAIRCE